jgi:hypothetical protein
MLADFQLKVNNSFNWWFICRFSLSSQLFITLDLVSIQSAGLLPERAHQSLVMLICILLGHVGGEKQVG